MTERERERGKVGFFLPLKQRNQNAPFLSFPWPHTRCWSARGKEGRSPEDVRDVINDVMTRMDQSDRIRRVKLDFEQGTASADCEKFPPSQIAFSYYVLYGLESVLDTVAHKGVNVLGKEGDPRHVLDIVP